MVLSCVLSHDGRTQERGGLLGSALPRNRRERRRGCGGAIAVALGVAEQYREELPLDWIDLGIGEGREQVGGLRVEPIGQLRLIPIACGGRRVPEVCHGRQTERVAVLPQVTALQELAPGVQQ